MNVTRHLLGGLPAGRLVQLVSLLALAFGVVGCNSMTGGIPVAGEPGQATATAASEAPASEPAQPLSPPLIVVSTDTPPPATATVAATITPEATPTAEETATATPTALPPAATTAPPAQPAPTVAPPPATAVPPTQPPPTEAPAVGANGLVASHFAIQPRSNLAVNQPVWFEFTVANSTGDDVSYNALGVMPRKDGVDRPQWYQNSYGGRNSTIAPGGFSWEDNIKLPEAGEYTLRLVVCFDGFDPCLQQQGTWHSLSSEIRVTIQ